MAFGLSHAVVLMVVVFHAVAAFNHDLDGHWENFKNTFGKAYSVAEETSRRQIFEDHVANIVKHNLEFDLGKHTYRKGLNQFVDLRNDEFVKQMNGYKGVKVNEPTRPFGRIADYKLPATVDWRDKKIVTGVKNQQQCGSCWAFSTTGSLEGQHALKTGKLVSLSEQNLVDCSGPEGNMGCEGGLMDQAFEYIEKNGGIDTEGSYPYTAQDGTCHYKKGSSGATCKGFVDIPTGDEKALQQAVAKIGPVSVAIDASQESFQLYSGGIYSEPECSSEQLDHGVLAVGYGTEDGSDYWLVKNSWGATWGEKGYIKMSRNQNNQCGIATQASYPLV